MLSNAYFLAKFRFDTAENEPAKNLQNFRKMHFSKNAFSKNARDYRGSISRGTASPLVNLTQEDPASSVLTARFDARSPGPPERSREPSQLSEFNCNICDKSRRKPFSKAGARFLNPGKMHWVCIDVDGPAGPRKLGDSLS